MKRFFQFLIFALVCGACATVGLAAAVNPAGWHEDLTYLANTLPTKHPAPFIQVSKPAWQQAIAQLDAQLPKLSEAEIVTGMARLVAMLGDPHTTLNLNQPGLDFHYYPLALTWLGDGYYVTGTTPEHQTLLGGRLLRINGKDAAAVEQEIGTLIPHDNDSWLKEMAPYYINAAEILNALHITASPGAETFDFQARDGAVLRETLQPVSLTADFQWQTLPDTLTTPLPLSRQNPNRFYWYQYLPESQSVYLQYNSCRDLPSNSFAKFNRGLFGFIDKHPINRLIVDLRFNSGGNPGLLDPFLNELKKRTSLMQPGRLMVLIGGKTFDAAVPNALRLRSECSAVLIGETTGDKPNYFGEVKSLRLPNSGIEITCATKYFPLGKTALGSLAPDLTVTPLAEEYFQGLDPVLNRALQ